MYKIINEGESSKNCIAVKIIEIKKKSDSPIILVLGCVMCLYSLENIGSNKISSNIVYNLKTSLKYWWIHHIAAEPLSNVLK